MRHREETRAPISAGHGRVCAMSPAEALRWLPGALVLAIRKQQVLGSNPSVGSTTSRVEVPERALDRLRASPSDPYADPYAFPSVAPSTGGARSTTSMRSAATRPSAGMTCVDAAAAVTMLYTADLDMLSICTRSGPWSHLQDGFRQSRGIVAPLTAAFAASSRMFRPPTVRGLPSARTRPRTMRNA